MTEKLRAILSAGRRVVFFGGAGVSTESGIPDFRSADGLYRQKYAYPPETILSHSFFVRNTEEFYRFYRDRMLPLSARPNAAHTALARMEAAGKLTAVVTQNIDGLHQAAGSRNVFELHGSIHRNHCTQCGAFYPARFIAESRGIPRCECGGIVKPDVVLYEEPLDDAVTEGAIRAIRNADVLIIAGTSLTVYPAAGMIDFFRGDHIVLINRDATGRDSAADLVIRDRVGAVLGCLNFGKETPHA